MARSHSSGELPSLTEQQVAVLSRFVRLDASLDEIRNSLEGAFRFDFESSVRTSECHFKISEPGVMVRRPDVMRALEARSVGARTRLDVMYWATMILHNEAFEIDATDEDFIAEVLNELSFDVNPMTNGSLEAKSK